MTVVMKANPTGVAEELVEANISVCLQCRKCTSGCPVAGRADIKPHELVQLVRLGQTEEVLGGRMIWECTSCQTCATRCPQKVSIAALNDALRQMSKQRGKAGAGNAVVIFNEIFLKMVRGKGRMHEAGLMAFFKLRTRRFFEDVGKVPMMLKKRKLALLPKSAGDKTQRNAMFERVAQAGGKKR